MQNLLNFGLVGTLPNYPLQGCSDSINNTEVIRLWLRVSGPSPQMSN